MAVAGGGALERITGHALDFRDGVFGHVASASFVPFALHFVLAEINVARQFADDFEVAIAQALGTQRRNSAQRRPQANGPQIDVKPEFLAEAEQPGFRARAKRQRFPLRTADRAEQNRIR